MTQESFEDSKIKFDVKSLKSGGVSLCTRLLLRLWPSKGIVRLAKEFGLSTDLMEKVNALFKGSPRVDVVPLASGERGFQIILDNTTALYFYQNGDHFEYDGCEVGKYEGGDVTIFDHLR